MEDLKEHMLYRIAYNADEPKLRGKVVVFFGWHEMAGDIRRARVRLMNADGSTSPENEWLVNPTIIIKV